MIFDFILNIIFDVLNLVISPFSLLPDVSLTGELADAIATIKPYYASLSEILPIGTLVAIIAVEVIVDGSILTYKLIRWGYQKLPFIN